MIRRACTFLAAAVLIAATNAASAVTIEKIVSPSGIEAWLVRDKSVPLITLNYAFNGGASQDDAGKSGAAHFAADLLDEGAGELDSKTFHESHFGKIRRGTADPPHPGNRRAR